jgi:hypothetical protein
MSAGLFRLPFLSNNLTEEILMKNMFTVDMDKLNEILERPVHVEEFQAVFSFVETITGKKYNPDNLTSEDIAVWNQRFDEVLQQLCMRAK